MPVFTVQNIIDRAVSAADMHDLFVTPTEWLAWFNAERQALDILSARSGWVLNRVSTTTIPGAATYAHPTEVMAIIGVWEAEPGGRFRPIVPRDYVSNFVQSSVGPFTGPAVFYSAVTDDSGQTTFTFYPRPTSGNYIIAFLDATPTATAVTDSVRFPMGIEERLVLGMARRALDKEESETSAIEKRVAREEQRVEEVAASKLFAYGAKVRDVDLSERGWGLNGFEIPPSATWLWL